MFSDITYYFSKWTFLFTTLFILTFSTWIIYFSLQFYPSAYSILSGSPLLLFMIILPEYMRTFYFLVTRKPALWLTKEKLIDNFKHKEYKWSEIKDIRLEGNGPRTPGFSIVLYLKNTEKKIQIPDIKLKGKKFDILGDLVRFHNRYTKRNEATQ